MNRPDLICLSHLRWNFVFQRPQHLMTRFARERRVYFLEEPTFGSAVPQLSSERKNGVSVITPQLPGAGPTAETPGLVQRLLQRLLEDQRIVDPLLWIYTPMMAPLVADVPAAAVVYDCMDELSAFAFAPPELGQRERALMARADLVFTGGQSLYEAKRSQHPRVHAFPSSVDAAHFARARAPQADPDDQAAIPGPRLGYCGVIDERMDVALIGQAAALRPDWHFVMIGPVVKIADADLPRAANIHYLGMKSYEELPRYLAGWDVALLPFARNDATRYISPTKTPEYLAAGLPVVSTSVRDVVRPYGQHGYVRIADAPDDFVTAVAAALDDGGVSAEADRYIAGLSWDRTWHRMQALIDPFERADDAAVDSARPAAGLGAARPSLGVSSSNS